jgi:hypothetical protein
LLKSNRSSSAGSAAWGVSAIGDISIPSDLIAMGSKIPSNAHKRTTAVANNGHFGIAEIHPWTDDGFVLKSSLV